MPNFFNCLKKYIRCCPFLTIDAVLFPQLRSLEIVDPRNVNVSTCLTTVLSIKSWHIGFLCFRKSIVISQVLETFNKNKLTSILRLTEKTYYSTLLEKQRTNVKGTWKILNKVINKKYSKPTYPEYFLKNNKRISKTEDIANGFNLFFLQMLVQIWQKISHYLTKMFRFMICS